MRYRLQNIAARNLDAGGQIRRTAGACEFFALREPCGENAVEGVSRACRIDGLAEIDRRNYGSGRADYTSFFAESSHDFIDTIYQFCIENNIYDFRIIDELVYEQTELINPYTTETSY